MELEFLWDCSIQSILYLGSLALEVKMQLTEENKDHIDSLSYKQLLREWRFAPSGDPWFQGETGEYWGERLNELRDQPGGMERHVAASKAIGWGES